jgi:hypothetical protein
MSREKEREREREREKRDICDCFGSVFNIGSEKVVGFYFVLGVIPYQTS